MTERKNKRLSWDIRKHLAAEIFWKHSGVKGYIVCLARLPNFPRGAYCWGSLKANSKPVTIMNDPRPLWERSLVEWKQRGNLIDRPLEVVQALWGSDQRAQGRKTNHANLVVELSGGAIAEGKVWARQRRQGLIGSPNDCKPAGGGPGESFHCALYVSLGKGRFPVDWLTSTTQGCTGRGQK